MLVNKLNGSSFESAPIHYILHIHMHTTVILHLKHFVWCESLYFFFFFFCNFTNILTTLISILLPRKRKIYVYACVCLMFKICEENRNQNQNPKQTEKSLSVLNQKCSPNIFGWKTLSWLVISKIFEVKKRNVGWIFPAPDSSS